ncbi:ATP-binding protein [Actinomycetospora cinnamomea]|uniref:histidine kinase n=1 Tax=Actinomycetospora cinnamomea TaxID=663609 RepID=A0A2U1E9D8_9PSEU|nr:ATP-binding protein [Actinomycetospora cinnamomea]PVY96510.1 PAS domain S-box-containing protein [Actinomycetospora cinnamomea]
MRAESAADEGALFAGGGRVGADMAEVDWAATPLGPPGTWPTPLRTTVRTLLTSRFAMWMAWGPELTVFYNDAYWRDTLQSKHPWALGKSIRVIWSEIWPDIEPRIASVLDTGVATWDEDLLLFLERSGYPEETYHTFSYSPLADDEGAVRGLLCVVTESTDRVVGDRRMATLRDLATAVGTARSQADVLGAVEHVLAANDRDVPFGLVYLFDEETGTARLAAGAGAVRGSATAPEVIEPGAGPWPLDRATGTTVVDDLASRCGPDVPSGAWDRPPARAVLVPLPAAPGQGTEGGPGSSTAGVLVVGANPHRPLDERMASFLELVGGQVAAGLARAGSYEAERRRAEALAELDRAKTDFFSNVSHEFRTPLTLIMGPVEDLRAADEVDPERWRAELEVVHRNGQRLGRLVNSLLDFSRLQAGRHEAHFVPIDLATATAELAGVFRSAMERAGLEYVVDCPPLPRRVLVDRDAWEKVVLNLLSNALKFTVEGRVTVRLEAAADAAVLHVTDTGVGIPADELPRLFERFHRVAGGRARSGEGSGIGLALVRELVALHGGEVSAESETGAGTTMTVRVPFGRAHLPADQVTEDPDDTADVPPPPSAEAESFVSEALRWLPDAEQSADAPPAAPADGARSATGAAGGRVLVADDNADMRAYLQRLLAPQHEVRLAADGEEALQAALADPPEIVVSDVMMPRRDGLSMLAALRDDERTSRIPVLLLSARAGQEAAVEGLAARADDYLVKPFTAPELRARVDAHLQLGRARRRAEDRFTAMADLAPAMIWVADPDGGRTFHNAGWRRFTGRDEGEERGDGWQDGLHPDDRDRYHEVTAAAMAAGEGWEIEFRLRRGDGAHHRVVEHAVPLPGEEGVSGWVGSCVDVNARALEADRHRLLARVGAELDGEPEMVDRLERLVHVLVDVGLAEHATVRSVGEDGRPAWGCVAVPSWDAGPGAGPGTPPANSSSATRRTAAAPADSVTREEREAITTRAPVTAGATLSLPLLARDRAVAVLTLQRHAEAPTWDDDDRGLVEEVADRAALALDNALLLAEERATADRLALLQRATTELSAAATPTQVAEVAVEHLQALFGSTSRVAVFEYEPESGNLALLVARNAEAPFLDPTRETPSLVGAAVDGGEPLWLLGDHAASLGGGGGEGADGRAGSRLDPAIVARLRESDVRGAMALPLVAAGIPVGAIKVGLVDRARISRTERNTLMALAEPCAMALDRARLYRAEHQIADTLQRSLLPQALPTVDRLGLAVRYIPGATGTQAGGDWYDVVALDGDRVAVAVGDVVGQGTAAAAVMGQLRTALSGYLLAGHGPAEALGLLDGLTARIPGARASTAMCLILDLRSGALRWARAGHLPALLVAPASDGDGPAVRYLDDPAGHGPLLGLPPDRRGHGEAVATLEPGAALVLYTDGLVERRGESLDDGLARLAEAAQRHRDAGPEPLASALLADLGGRSDDVALVVARLLPPPLEMHLPAQPESLSLLRRRVARWARVAALPAVALDDLQLALGESATNAVEHAYQDVEPGVVDVRLARCADGTIEVSVRDHGAWRPVPADPGYRGRGLTLVRELTRETEVTPAADGGTRVRFLFDPDGAGGPDAPETPDDTDTEPDAASGTDPADDTAPPPAGSPATVTVQDDAAGRRIVLRGDLDLAAASSAREPVLDAVDVGDHVVLDLRAVGHLASAGVGLVLEALQRTRGRGARAGVRTRPGSPAARVVALAMPEEA